MISEGRMNGTIDQLKAIIYFKRKDGLSLIHVIIHVCIQYLTLLSYNCTSIDYSVSEVLCTSNVLHISTMLSHTNVKGIHTLL